MPTTPSRVTHQAGTTGQHVSKHRWRQLLLPIACFAALLWAAAWHADARPARGQTEQGDNADEIVFIDLGGFLRVYDYVDNGTAIRWFSPIGGFTDAALGDVNADGDMEVIGVRGGMEDGELVVYDPVVQNVDSAIPIDGYINGVPWATLHTRSTPGEPTLVGAGDLDLSAPGDEIVFGSRINDDIAEDDDAFYQVTTLRGITDPPTGTDWRPLVEQAEFDEVWNWLDVGDLDNQGADEIVLVSVEEGWLHVYRDLLSEPFFRRENQSRPWQGAVVGRFFDRNRPDLLAVRGSAPGVDNFWVFRYLNGRWRDGYFESFFPPPETIFTADAEGSGGDEAFMLRSVPENVNNRPRLFSRDELGRSIIEDNLANTNNGFQAGAGGNIDGDFGDEVVIIRDSRIRIYTSPRENNSFEEIPVSTNSRTVRIGNLDGGVFQPAPLLTVNNQDSVQITAALQQGLVQAEADLTEQVEVVNSTTAQVIPFSFTVDEDPALPPNWVIVEANQLQTPATLNIRFDTTRLDPGVYETTIRLRSDEADTRNQPVRIFVTLTVEEGIAVLPYPALFLFSPCSPPVAAQERIFTIRGPFDLQYAVGVGEGGVPTEWATVSPPGGTIPSTFSVRVDPSAFAESSYVSSTLTVVPVNDTSGVYGPRTIPLYALCAQGQSLLPLIRR